MPLKERGGELLREFININYKLINSHGSMNRIKKIKYRILFSIKYRVLFSIEYQVLFLIEYRVLSSAEEYPV